MTAALAGRHAPPGGRHGMHDEGQLGDGSTDNTGVSQPIIALANAVEICGGENHSCAALMDRSVWCWGNGAQGQLGAGSGANSHVPQRTNIITTATEVACGGNSSCATLADGSLRCWGNTVGTGTGFSNQPVRPDGF